MGDRVCPNCGNTLTDTDSSCSCGYSLQDDDGAVPSPGIVRSTGPRAAATAINACQWLGRAVLYFGGGWVLTARHVGAGDLTLDDNVYPMVPDSKVQLASGDGSLWI